MKEGTIITCQQSQVLLKVNSTEEDLAQVEVTDSGKGEIFQYDRISFDDLDNDDEEITERDKKDILWGLEYGAHVIGLSCANTAEHVESVKAFLDQNNAGEMKVFAKIETRSGLKNLNEILGIADGIILVLDELSDFKEEEKLILTIQMIKQSGKPVLITETNTEYGKEYSKYFTKQVQVLSQEYIDGIMLEPFLVEDEVFDAVEQTGDIL